MERSRTTRPASETELVAGGREHVWLGQRVWLKNKLGHQQPGLRIWQSISERTLHQRRSLLLCAPLWLSGPFSTLSLFPDSLHNWWDALRSWVTVKDSLQPKSLAFLARLCGCWQRDDSLFIDHGRNSSPSLSLLAPVPWVLLSTTAWRSQDDSGAHSGVLYGTVGGKHTCPWL